MSGYTPDTSFGLALIWPGEHAAPNYDGVLPRVNLWATEQDLERRLEVPRCDLVARYAYLESGPPRPRRSRRRIRDNVSTLDAYSLTHAEKEHQLKVQLIGLYDFHRKTAFQNREHLRVILRSLRRLVLVQRQLAYILGVPQ